MLPFAGVAEYLYPLPHFEYPGIEILKSFQVYWYAR